MAFSFGSHMLLMTVAYGQMPRPLTQLLKFDDPPLTLRAFFVHASVYVDIYKDGTGNASKLHPSWSSSLRQLLSFYPIYPAAATSMLLLLETTTPPPPTLQQ